MCVSTSVNIVWSGMFRFSDRFYEVIWCDGGWMQAFKSSPLLWYRTYQNWGTNSNGRKCWFRSTWQRSITGSKCWRTLTSSTRNPQSCRRGHWRSWSKPPPTCRLRSSPTEAPGGRWSGDWTVTVYAFIVIVVWAVLPTTAVRFLVSRSETKEAHFCSLVRNCNCKDLQ